VGDPSRVGSIVASKYRLDAELGRGGMGAVYRAYHLLVHKEFAVKVLHSDVREHRSIASRFFLEAQAAGRIGHPGILDVYDVGEDADGVPFIVMELLRGEPLSSLVNRAPVEIDAACWISMKVLDALDAAHRVGVIHRDVKPQNVFLTEREARDKTDDPARAEDGTPSPSSATTRGVKLLDFGIAKFGDAERTLTRSGEIIGSPLYMAPEQATGEADLDARADIWSVGAMLFQMLTGKCAHAATTPVAVLAKILTEPAPAPSTRNAQIPSDVDAIVGKALRIDRDERFASAREMHDALAAVRKKRGTAHQAPSLPPPSKQPVFVAETDRTPNAITSTVESEVDAPQRRPSSGEVRGEPGQGRKSVARDERRPRSRVLGMLVAGLGVAVLVPWYFHFVGRSEGARDPTPASLTTASAPSMTSVAALPSVTNAAAVTTTVAVASGVPEPVLASARPGPAASRIAPVGPRCGPNEIVSRGHCCGRGLEWQGSGCARPLATSF
jgi:eukaryotic-like serine/threonine-protein kinase